ncbi:hypothetical protein SDC9_45950 [bioreactor metagenome]|uniref:Uncharacterized protein n=1 Tax=bioreactor metagenome TaxID=1076179 RepID=A0A644W7I7_9ZZZZ
MFHDKRSKKVIFVSHCVLNQNAKLDQCAHYPGAIREVAELLVSGDAGIIQLPCPELLYLGLDRETDESANPTVASEDTRISKRMSEEKAKELCRKIVGDTVYQIEEYRKNGFEVTGLIGINGSPTCGVETTWAEGEEIDGPGIFMRLLKEELDKKNINLNMAGIRANNPQSAARAVKKYMNEINRFFGKFGGGSSV